MCQTAGGAAWTRWAAESCGRESVCGRQNCKEEFSALGRSGAAPLCTAGLPRVLTRSALSIAAKSRAIEVADGRGSCRAGVLADGK
eukprot:scaffold2368_cov72-Phaeocystis_antarctica.AAC.5